MQHFRMLAEHLSWTSIDDVAVIDDVHAVREAERCPDVLLDDHDRLTGLGKPAAGGEQLSHDDGREPLAGMSPRERKETVQLLKNIARGRTLVVVEHDMDAIFELAERITVLHEGALLAEGTPSEVRRNGLVQEAYLGGMAAA